MLLGFIDAQFLLFCRRKGDELRADVPLEGLCLPTKTSVLFIPHTGLFSSFGEEDIFSPQLLWTGMADLDP
jgi:hypothetical protein